MSKKLYNTFGELIDLENIETFGSTCKVKTSLKNKYRDWIPRNEKEKIAVHSVRLVEEALKKVTLTKADIEKARTYNLTNNEAKQATYFNISFD